MQKKKLIAALGIVAVVTAFFMLDLDQYFSLESFKARQTEIESFYLEHPWQTIGAYLGVYLAVTGLSLPGAAVLGLAAGALFGLALGTLLVSFASSIGATLAFLIARYLLREPVQARFGGNLKAINAGIEKEGAFYLFSLRLVPLFPYFVINLVMGLTPIRTWTFYWVSQVGMLAGTMVFVNAGVQIAELDSAAGILSPGLIASFTLLGLFPLLAKRLLRLFQARKALARYPRPAVFDRDLVVIGGGSAGLVSAYIAAALRAKVTLVEAHRMGGDCLNTGCIPSKALIRSARFLSELRRADRYGVGKVDFDFSFADVMERVQRVIRQVEPHDSVERYTALGVECLQGQAVIETPYTVRVGERILTTRAIVIAAGARPFVPPVPGLEEAGYLTSDTVWGLRELPQRLAVLGGGPIGCELAQSFARLGSRVTQIEMLPRLLIREDPEVAERVAAGLREDGVDVRVGHRALEVRIDGKSRVVVCDFEGERIRLECDQVLVAVGRRANTRGYGLEELGIALAKDGTIETDAYLQTRYSNVYACGDVAGPYQFTHTASHQAWYAAVNALFGGWKRFRVDYSVIPWTTFTDPEVARVGLNEQDALERGIAYEVTLFDLGELDRAIADEEAAGVVKVLTVPGKDRILGATIAGPHAGELITEFVTAMRHGLGMNKILGTIHVYPTLSEANKYAAGAWKRAHAPQSLLGLLERYHAWRRGRP